MADPFETEEEAKANVMYRTEKAALNNTSRREECGVKDLEIKTSEILHRRW